MTKDAKRGLSHGVEVSFSEAIGYAKQIRLL